MGTSNWQQIPFCVDVLMKMAPRRVLDVGVGFGRWGMIVREFCDVWYERVFRDQWAVHVEGIEAFPRSIADYHRAFYDKIHVGDAGEILPALEGRWDVTVYGDVLEHFSKEVAHRLLETSLDRSDYVLINIPLGEEHEQGEAYGNVYERHLSSWEPEDFEPFGLVRRALFLDHAGRPHGSFCLSRNDPRDLRGSLFSKFADYGEPGATDGGAEELERVLDRVAEQSFELGYVKQSASYRLARRLRRTSFWHAARWVRNRNRGVVRVRALGRKNPASQGSQVWLLHAGHADERSIPWEFVEQDGSWGTHHEERAPYGMWLVGERGRLRLPIGDDPKLTLMRHPWSGLVEVSYQGRRETLDLYSSVADTVTLRPGRTDGNGAAPAAAPPTLAAVPARFSPAEEAFIASVRGANAPAVAMHCPRWLGVTSSTRALFAHTYAIPPMPDGDPFAMDEASLNHHAAVLAATGVRRLVVSGGDEVFLRVIERIRTRDPNVRFDLLWHGSYVQFSEDYVWELIRKWIHAVRAGLVHGIGTVKEGMERFLQSVGVPSRLVLNYVPGTPEAPPEIPGDERHVGLWLSGVGFRKTPHAMLAALTMVPRSRLHATGIGVRGREVAEFFDIPCARLDTDPLPAEELRGAIRRTHLTLYVTFSECCPMIPLESMHWGVPTLIGPTSHLFRDHPYLFERLVVSFPDRADVIAEHIERALAEREEIMAEYARYIPTYNEAARRSVERFLE